MELLIDIFLDDDVPRAGETAAAAESAGYDGVLAAEVGHDPFVHMLRAALTTERVAVGTAIAVAFARTPMVVAASGYDLAEAAQGRFILGLGSQIKPHIERRFSMPWSKPAARMREFVLALHAIWACWHDGERLSFEGDFYTHTLMTPFFSQKPHSYGPPPVYIAGVGPLMTEAAGEVADGFFFHPLTTSRYLSEVTIPGLAAGRAKAGKAAGARGLDGFVVAGPAFAAIGRDEAELATAIEGVKRQLSFYCSTPAYRPVLDLHGWGDIQPELTRMTKEDRWAEMGELITDEMVAAFAEVGTPAEVGKGLRQRWTGVADRISLYTPYKIDPAVFPEVIDAIRASG